jgi:polyhydroxyalkanoate synthesis regulator phasin
MRMKKLILVLGLVSLIFATGVSAQAEPSTDLSRAVIQAERKVFVEAAVQPSPQQADAFWKTYWEYRGQIKGISDRYVALVEEFVESYGSLNDDQASRMVKEAMAIDLDHVKVKQKYFKRFNKVLTSRQVARLYQIESKMDAVIKAELAAVIPLER